MNNNFDDSMFLYLKGIKFNSNSNPQEDSKSEPIYKRVKFQSKDQKDHVRFSERLGDSNLLIKSLATNNKNKNNFDQNLVSFMQNFENDKNWVKTRFINDVVYVLHNDRLDLYTQSSLLDYYIESVQPFKTLQFGEHHEVYTDFYIDIDKNM